MARSSKSAAFDAFTKPQLTTYVGEMSNGDSVEVVFKPLRGTDNLIGLRRDISKRMDGVGKDEEKAAHALEDMIVAWLPKVVVSVKIGGESLPNLKGIKPAEWRTAFHNMGGVGSDAHDVIMGVLGIPKAEPAPLDEGDEDDTPF